MDLSEILSNTNVSFIQFLYGVSFITIAGGILLKRREIAHFGLTDSFVVLAVFGIFHGLADLLPLFPMNFELPATLVSNLSVGRLLVSILSFQFLLYFAFVELTRPEIRLRWLLYLSPLVIGVHYVIAANMLVNLRIAYRITGVFLAFPSSLLASMAFAKLSSRFRAIDVPHLARDFLVLSAAFVAFGLLKLWPTYSSLGVLTPEGVLILMARALLAMTSAIYVVKALSAFKA